MVRGSCRNRAESAAMNDLSRSLVLVNYFRDLPNFPVACKDNSAVLTDKITDCHAKSGRRWANFIAVDFYHVCCHFVHPWLDLVHYSSSCMLHVDAEERPRRRGGGHGQVQRRPRLRVREHLRLQCTVMPTEPTNSLQKHLYQ
jgi:hypothetical protein